MRVLVIEDDRNFGLILKTELEADNHMVEVASDGVEGVLLFIRHRHEFVLVDIRLPRLTGIDALRIIHGLDPAVPAIAFSGNAGSQEVTEILAAGASACLAKPFAISRLRFALESIH